MSDLWSLIDEEAAQYGEDAQTSRKIATIESGGCNVDDGSSGAADAVILGTARLGELLQGPYEIPAWFTPTHEELDYLTGKVSFAEFSSQQQAAFVRRFGPERGPAAMREHNVGLTNYAAWLQDTGFFDRKAHN